MKKARMLVVVIALVIRGGIVVMAQSKCFVRLDRTVIAGNGFGIDPSPPGIPGFKVVRDVRIRRQGKIATYERVRTFRSETNSSQVFLQYRRLVPWVKPWRFSVVADDQTGILPEEMSGVIANCADHTVMMIELAFDFPAPGEVDRDYALRYGRFGKSHRRPKVGGPDYLRYGSRGSPKLVRCYFKPEVGSYRVELECHSALLQNLGISKVTDLGKLAGKLCPGHLQFVSFRENELESHLVRKFGSDDGLRILDEAAEKYTSLQRASRFLANKGVANVHRFLKPRAINKEVERALDRWAQRFTPDALDPKEDEMPN